MLFLKHLRGRPALFAVLLLLVGGVAIAGSPALRAAAQRPFAARGTVVVPDRFLRAWDPVTVFFDGARGPAGGGAEDDPGRFARFAPAHPGAWTWLDAKTLQFRPAEPWPALGRYAWTVEGRTTELATLLAPPVSTLPEDGAEGLGPIEAITLGFTEPIDPAALARVVSIELRPLPGVDATNARWLGSADLAVKAVEELPRGGAVPMLDFSGPEASGSDTGSSASDTGSSGSDTGYGGSDTGYGGSDGPPSAAHRYVLTLDTPIPLGTRAIVHFRLSRDDTAAESAAQVSFSTAEPFRVTSAGCGDRLLPVAPEGVRYGAEQALACSAGRRVVALEFSARPAAIGPIEARNLVRISPEPDDLAFSLSGRRLEITGRFAQETAYRVSVVPTPLRDVDGRALANSGPAELSLWFPRQDPYLRLTAGEGILERFGPQAVPMDGRGHARADLRIYKVDPLDRTFWPFPGSPLVVDESEAPAGPGEEPDEIVNPNASASTSQMAAHVALLGSPGVSRVIDLPIGPAGDSATFGLDLSTHLATLGGKGAPGTYLVGVRTLDGSVERSWMRVQVTDLSLTTVEEIGGVRFVVTSLHTGDPVPGAEVRLEGVRSAEKTEWTTLASGRTGSDGAFAWTPPGELQDVRNRLRRVVVAKGPDTLVLSADEPPPGFADNRWSVTSGTWLGWGWGRLDNRGPKPQSLCTLFSERPVYRPEDTVHLKGWARTRAKGALTPIQGPGDILVSGPGDLSWKLEADPTPSGGFYARFAEADLPSGTYTARFEGEGPNGRFSCGQMTFQMEAYRLPTFEATLVAPEVTASDAPFSVKLVASYFAGGRVAGRPVRWRVTQYPATWAPKARPGFLYSSDGRYSGGARFDATPAWESDARTDADGGATLPLDPTIEPTAQPRTYVVEATVTGEDDQTVTTTRRVDAVPAFVLGLKVPRYIERAAEIPVELLAAGPDGSLLGGQAVTVRLLSRQWHSHLQASDFSDGDARYVTDVVEEEVSRQTVKTGAEPTRLALPIVKAGVYVVELESRDKLGRAQVVKVDLYAGGADAVAWQKPQAGVFGVVPDRKTYDPGQTAALVLQSPFQKADALIVVEAPEGNRYQWVSVNNGAATFKLPIEGTWAPRVPVHTILMRGRTPDSGPVGASTSDLGKPATLANTTWLVVNPVSNQVVVKLENPARATPGEEIPVTVRLTTPQGAPVGGEVALWLVDQAVLSLGREQRLDPLPDFITAVRSFLFFRDTRNLAFGRIPFAAIPGGDGGGEEEAEEQVTVRKNFQPVPYYQPALQVPSSGVLTVKVKLPDDLTVFKIRAKAAAGPDRFGVGTSELAVRLPVLVQPALPRFVRPGDRFQAAAVARVVEGAGGAGTVTVRAEGLTLATEKKSITLDEKLAVTAAVEAQVPTPAVGADGTPARTDVTVRMFVARAADGAKDAVEVTLPIRPDRAEVVRRDIVDVTPGKPATIPALAEAARPGTLRRSWLVSAEPAVTRMAGGLDFLLEYPHGTTEARVSRARALLGLGALRGAMNLEDPDGRVDRAVGDALAWLPGVLDDRGRVAQWPGTKGTVSLTAWSLSFLVEAKAAGKGVDDALLRTLSESLGRALRSDYADFVSGEAYMERALALQALAAAGKFDAGYFAELARTAKFLEAEGVANVVVAASLGGQGEAPVTKGLAALLGDGVVTRLWQGREVYGGLPGMRTARSGYVLPSETRVIASITRALARVAPDHARLPLLRDALVTLGRGDGWGSTNANAEAMIALAEWLQAPRESAWTVELVSGGRGLPLERTGAVAHARDATTQAVEVKAGGAPVSVRVDSRYVPEADGGKAPAITQGFVVTRTIEVLQPSGPPTMSPLDAPGQVIRVPKGGIVEDHVQLVVPEDRTYVALELPLAAGLEALNPRLATAPPEATPRTRTTAAPTYADWRDDAVVLYWDSLPKGTYDVAFRARATVAGDFVLPSARAERLYDAAVVGATPGARVVVE
jgi:uncharacterized protein YfaS (alpha-2-macroglobulin family)